MNNDNTLDIDIDLSGIVDGEGTAAPGPSSPTPSTPTPTAQPAAQPAEAAQPQAQAPASLPAGPLTTRLQAELSEVERRYQEALARKKSLAESGYSVPGELETEIAGYTARREVLRLQLEDAVRRDAMAQVPVLARSLLQGLPPGVARLAEPHLHHILNSIAANNPDVLKDTAAMQNAVNLAVGLAVKENVERRIREGAPLPASGVPQIPVAKPAQKNASLEELSSRMGTTISQKSWEAVANANPDEPLPLF